MDPALELLPDYEWDYSEIPENSLSATFYWEYARFSGSVSFLIGFTRSRNSYLASKKGAVGATFNPWDGKYQKTLSGCSEREMKILESPENARILKEISDIYRVCPNPPFNNQIGYLAEYCPYFPAHCIRFMEGYGKAGFMEELRDEFQAPVVVKKFIPDQTNSIDWLDHESVDPSEAWTMEDTLLMSRKVNAQHFSVTIPNNLNLSEIIEQFTEKLKQAWPKELNKSLSKSSAYKGVGGVRLGFGKRAALEWLGVYKRFLTCDGSWVKFLERYPQSGDPQSIKRKLREQSGKAQEIIKWFNALGTGEMTTTNGGRQLKWKEGVTP